MLVCGGIKNQYIQNLKKILNIGIIRRKRKVKRTWSFKNYWHYRFLKLDIQYRRQQRKKKQDEFEKKRIIRIAKHKNLKLYGVHSIGSIIIDQEAYDEEQEQLKQLDKQFYDPEGLGVEDVDYKVGNITGAKYKLVNKNKIVSIYSNFAQQEVQDYYDNSKTIQSYKWFRKDYLLNRFPSETKPSIVLSQYAEKNDQYWKTSYREVKSNLLKDQRNDLKQALQEYYQGSSYKQRDLYDQD
eukprot:403350600